MKRSFQIYWFFFIALTIVACKNKKKDIDVSNIHLNIHIERFDKSLGQLTPQNIQKEAPVLQQQYGEFYEDFIKKMLGAGNPKDTIYYKNLRLILKNPDYKDLLAEVQQKFKSLKPQEAELTDAFKHVRYYYPKQKIPRLISFFSGFAVQVPVGNDYLGIGLDMFLGANSKFYPAIRQSIPEFITRRFNPQNITPRVMEAFIREDMFSEPPQATSFLDKMVYNGKILYFMKAVMPEVEDSVLIGYTSAQQEWCKKFEAGIWGYFLEQNLLYETDYMKIQKFLTEAPFTPGIGERNESSPKLALFTGWQIVKKYMSKNPKVTLQDLMKNTDYQEILNKSHYKPK